MAVGVPSDLLRRRPDIQAAERQLGGINSRRWRGDRAVVPPVGAGRRRRPVQHELGRLFNGNSNYYVAGPSVNWTVFDGGLRKAGVKLSEAQVDAAKAAYQDTVSARIPRSGEFTRRR